jgi:CubicO group peptidase (beta-lactamase class C family)
MSESGVGRRFGYAAAMTSRIACVAFAGLAVLCQSVVPKQDPVSDRLAEVLKKIDAASADVTPALVIAVTDRSRTLGVIAHGYADIKTKAPATTESLFPIGSIGKSFTAMALMELFDEGRFDPQAPLATYLPWFRVRSSPAPITGHHLLTHTAGLPRYRADLASTEFAAYWLRNYDVPYAPGTHYWYSNLGFQTLGYALERIEHAPLHSIIERRLLDRIGMSASTAIIDDALRTRLPVSYQTWPYGNQIVEQPWFEYSAGDGAISSTGEDMAKYVRVLLNRGALPGGRLISEAAFTLMTTPFKDDYAYGLGVRTIDGDTVLRHSGGIAGFSSVMEVHVNDGYGIVLLTNGQPSRELALWILAAVKAAMRGQPVPELPTTDTAPTVDARDPDDVDVPAALRPYVGRYKNHSVEDPRVRIFVRKGQLVAARGDADGEPLVRVGPALFKPVKPDFNPERYRFDSIVDGVALRLTFSGMPMYRVDVSR